MRTSRFNHLLGLVAEGKANERIKMELDKETKKIQADFQAWRVQVENFLFYVDKVSDNERLKRELFYRGKDPIDAGEILIGLDFGI